MPIEMESKKAMVLQRLLREQAYGRYFRISDRRFNLSTSCRQRLAAVTVSLLGRLGYLCNQERCFTRA